MINDQFKDEIEFSKPKRRLPRLKIKDIMNETNLTDDELVKIILRQNDAGLGQEANVKLLFKTKPRDGHFDICIEMESLM